MEKRLLHSLNTVQVVGEEVNGVTKESPVHLNSVRIDGGENLMDIVIKNNGGLMRKTFNKICNYLTYGRSFKQLSDKWLD
jgi:hypothetical protein